MRSEGYQLHLTCDAGVGIDTEAEATISEHHLRELAELHGFVLTKRDLLKRYMAKVIDCEGVSYVDDIDSHEVKLTEEELDELKAIEEEVRNDG